MIFFSQNYFKKPFALILVFCLISLSAGLIWFYPKETNAMCPVTITTDATGVKHIGLAQAWEATKAAVSKANLLETAISAAKLSWQAAKQYSTWIKNTLLNLLLHKFLSLLTNNIVDWIQNGGSPRFLSKDIGSYLKEAGESAAVDFLDQYLGAGWLCEPFDMSVKIALLDTPKFETEARCTFDDIGNNLREFYDDFTKGGWRGWLKVTEPKHNFYGMYLMALDEKNRVEAKAKEDADKEAAMGKGFLSVQECAWYDANGREVEGPKDTVGQPALPLACQPANPVDYNNPGITQGGFKGPCYSKCQTKTPGSMVSEIANDTIGNTFGKFNAQISGAISDTGPLAIYVTPIANALINRVVKEGLSFVGLGDEVPEQGDLGAGVDMPNIVSSENVIRGKDNALLLSRNLNSLKNNMQDDLFEAQKDNASVLVLIKNIYNETIPILNNIVANCADLSDQASQNYIIWAQDKIAELNSTTPALDQRINEINDKINASAGLINDISSAEILSQNYVIQAGNWIEVYEEVRGEEGNTELVSAELSFRTAERDLIESAQKIVQGINNVVASTDIEGLSQEIQDSVIAVVNTANNIRTETGNITWPEAGTLYAELEEATNLKSTAATRNNQCIQAQQTPVFSD